MNQITRGAAFKAFTGALRELNTEIAKLKRQGVRNYITKTDARLVYDNYKGRCAYCGLELIVRGRRENSAHFMFHIPLKARGKVTKENTILVCRRCKYEQAPPPRGPRRRIEEYNTIADIIQRLVDAVVLKRYDMITSLKQELNSAISEFVLTLQYKPIVVKEPCPIVEGTNSVADLVEQAMEGSITEKLDEVLETIKTTRQYRVLRSTDE